MTRSLVLLHGIARTRHSLWPVAREGAARGYTVASIGYPWRTGSIEELAAIVATRIAHAVPTGQFDVVAHSMGGIILRVATARGLIPAERIRRAVMLAPPSQGSELAETLRHQRLFRWVYGPAGQQLGTGAESAPLALPPLPFECGVIAGQRSLAPLAERIFDGPTDGRVSVARARADGMTDFMVVDRAHTFMMWGVDVLAATFGFLETGRFPHVAGDETR
jgi:pimeloyl-ACP methyl ester carboxylesterase